MPEVLAFGVGQARYAVEFDALDGVDPLGRVAAVPAAPPFLLGVTNRNGYLLPVADLRALRWPSRFQREPAAPPWLVVLRRGSRFLGLGSDLLPSMVEVEDEAVDAAATPEGDSDSSPLVRGTLRLPDGTEAALLDADAVLEAATVEDDAPADDEGAP